VALAEDSTSASSTASSLVRVSGGAKVLVKPVHQLHHLYRVHCQWTLLEAEAAGSTS